MSCGFLGGEVYVHRGDDRPELEPVDLLCGDRRLVSDEVSLNEGSWKPEGETNVSRRP